MPYEGTAAMISGAMVLTIVLVVLACVVALGGWILSLAGISGTWLILVATIGADLAIDHELDFVVSAIVFGLLCGVVELLEFLAGVLGAKALGGSRWSQVGAFVGTFGGGIAGSAVFPIVGTIVVAVIGGFAGALVGELLYAKKARGEGDAAMKAGLKAGFGAMLARAFSIAMKASLATLMIVWLVVVLVTGFSG